jgi:hydroxymethylbilane synthase
MPPPLRLGTRGSPLALWQAKWVQDTLRETQPERPVEVVIVKTQAEKFPERDLPEIGVGVFTKELDDALERGDIDCAVHSLKDVPSELDPALRLVAVPARESPLDAFVSSDGTLLANLPKGAALGTGSPRRKAQLLAYRPDLRIVPLRGNVGTRLRKMKEQGLAGTILAHAGLRRLAQEDAITELLSPDVVLPAVSQGALAIVARKIDTETHALLATLDHPPSHGRVLAERGFLRTLRGGCQVPAGALATIEADGTSLRIQAVLAATDGSRLLKGEQRGHIDKGAALGASLGTELLEGGGEDILRVVR